MRPNAPKILMFVVVLIGATFLASAQMGLNEGRTFPYAGHLDVDGNPAQGLHDLRFALFTTAPTPVEADCLLAENCPLWFETLVDVGVEQGRFSVTLGEDETLSDDILAQSSLYIAIAVRPQGGSFSVLSGSQKIEAMPWASRVASVENYSISGALSSGSISTAGARVQEGGTDNSNLLTGRALVVTSNSGSGAAFDGDVEFRHDDQTQGIGFGFNTIYATGSNANQILDLRSRGSDPVRLNPAGNAEVHVGATLRVGGVVEQGCPAGMNKIGSSCIDAAVTIGKSITWQATADICHSRGQRLCRPSEVNSALRLGLTTPIDFGEQDYWVWVDSIDHASGGCHVNMNFNQPTSLLGQINCQIPITTQNPNIGGLCCR